jgi:hypothetical protein
MRIKGTTIEKIRKWERVGQKEASIDFFNRAARLVTEIFGLPAAQICFVHNIQFYFSD